MSCIPRSCRGWSHTANGYQHLWGINKVFDQTYQQGPIRYEYGDITQTRFEEETFDAITCLSVIEHGVNLELYFKEMARILKRDGLLITSTDYWDSGVDAKGQVAFGAPIHIFNREEIVSGLKLAEQFCLEPISTINFQCREKAVRWEQHALDYTFIIFSLQKKVYS